MVLASILNDDEPENHSVVKDSNLTEPLQNDKVDTINRETLITFVLIEKCFATFKAKKYQVQGAASLLAAQRITDFISKGISTCEENRGAKFG